MWLPLTLALGLALTTAPKNVAPGNGKTQLKVEIQPPAAVLFVDGKKKGTGAKKQYLLTVTPGRHTMKVTHKGDEHQEDVFVKKGEVKLWTWAFEDDRRDRRGAAAPAEGEEAKPAEAAPSPPEQEEGRGRNGEPSGPSEVDKNEDALNGAFAPKKK
jgi:hypothetical protein